MPKVILALTLLIPVTSCMSAALRPRTTLEGRQFDVEQARAVSLGQTEVQVLDLLGEPFEKSSDGDQAVWSYYERFTPRGCDPPVVSHQFRVTFRAGLVTSTDKVVPTAER